jgi:hypothetical protein
MDSVIKQDEERQAHPRLTLPSFPHSGFTSTSIINPLSNSSVNRSDGSVVRAPRKCVLANTSIAWCSPLFLKRLAGTFNRGDRGFDSYSLHSIFCTSDTLLLEEGKRLVESGGIKNQHSPCS